MTPEEAKNIKKALDLAKLKRAEAYELEHNTLEAAGWRLSCSNPQSVWMWVKKSNQDIEINGETIKPVLMVNKQEALKFTQMEIEETAGEQ